jgi:hypothetical protein
LRQIEFAELRGDPVASVDNVRLAGRCYSGPIRLGDVFTVVVTADGEHEVALRVDRGLVYGRLLDEVHEGTSAEITLSGSGAEYVIARVLLRGGG